MAGGRPKGSLSVSRERLIQEVKERYGNSFNIIIEQVNLAQRLITLGEDIIAGNHDTITEESSSTPIASAVSAFSAASNAYHMAAKHLYPTLKAQEIKVDLDQRAVVVNMRGVAPMQLDNPDPQLKDIPPMRLSDLTGEYTSTSN